MLNACLIKLVMLTSGYGNPGVVERYNACHLVQLSENKEGGCWITDTSKRSATVKKSCAVVADKIKNVLQ